MTTNAPSPAASGAAAPRRRLGWVVAVFLLLLLLLGGGAAGVWWLKYRPAGGDGPPHTNAPGPVVTTGPVCSDDDDPKYLEHLDFGPPIETRFDRARLDALPGRPIADLEKYPWQPAELVAVLGEHRMRGQLFAASPDGATLAVGSPGDGFLRVGSTETVHEKAVLSCPGGAYALEWEPGGDHLAVSCGDGLVRLFDLRDLERIPDPVSLDKAGGMVTHLAYSADGKYLLGGDNTPKNGVAWVWDAAAGKIVNQLHHSGPVMGVAFSRVKGDYRALTGGGPEDGFLRLWDDARSGDKRAEIDFKKDKNDRTTYAGEVAFSPDGKQAASAHSDAVVRLWDLNRFELHAEIHSLGDHVPGGAPVLAWSPDGRFLATGRHNDAGVWLYDAGTGGKARVLTTANAFNEIRFLGKGDRVAFTSSVSNDWNAHIFETETGKELRAPLGHLNAVTCAAFAPDGRNVASGGADLAVRLWPLDTLNQRYTAVGGDVWGVGFLPDAKAVYYYGASWATLPLLDVESGQARTPAYDKQHNGAILSAAITRDGRFALTGGFQDGTVRLWRLSDGRQVRYFDLRKSQGPVAATLSPDMHRAVALAGARTCLLQLRCQQVLHEWPGVTAWAPFLPDAHVAFFGGAEAPVWEVTGDEPKETGRIGLNLGGPSAAALSGDGRRVAAVQGGKAVVYDVGTAKPIWEWTPPPPFGGVRGVALSPDGRDLLTANGDGTVYVVRLPEK